MSDDQNNEKEPWIAIARTGTWTDSGGHSHVFTAQDFDTLIQNYDPTHEEAPLVFGHPEMDGPAYGWVKGLKRTGEILFAQLTQVAAEVRQLVHSGAYRYVSMALHPSAKRLRHVGLLGAVPPAIKGLGPVQLADGDTVVTLTFAGPVDKLDKGERMDPTQMDTVMQRIRQLESELKEVKGQLAEREQDLAAAKQEKESTTAEFAAYRDEQVKSHRMARLDSLTQSGKVQPGEHKDIMAQVAALSKVPESIEFSDGGKITLEERLWKDLEARPASPLATNLGLVASQMTNQATYAGPSFSAQGGVRPPNMATQGIVPDLSRKI